MAKQLTAPGCTYTIVARVDTTIYSPDQKWTLDVPAGQHDFIAETNEIIIPGDAMMVRKSESVDKDLERVNVLGKGSGSLATFVTRAVEQIVGKGNVKVFYMPDSTPGLPAGYKLVEYLESTGTQYIISNVIPGDEVEIELVYFMSSEISAYSAVLGLSENQTKGSWRINVAGSNTHTGGLMAEYGWWQDYRANPIPSFNTKNKLYFWSRVNEYWTSIYKLNEEVIPFRSTGVTYPKNELERASYPLALFARKREGDAVKVDANCPCKIYSLKIATNGQNYYFIPCLDRTGAPCMYDLVSRKPFYNQGTGDFIYPTESTTYGLRRVLPDWGKLTDHGLRRLYHAPANYKGELYDYALENGYKPIVEPARPEEGYWAPHWTETADEIVLEWIETEPSTEENLTETEQ